LGQHNGLWMRQARRGGGQHGEVIIGNLGTAAGDVDNRVMGMEGISVPGAQDNVLIIGDPVDGRNYCRLRADQADLAWMGQWGLLTGTVDYKEESEAMASLGDRNSVDDMIGRANVSNLPHADNCSLSIFNCMSDDFLLFISLKCGIRVGDDLTSISGSVRKLIGR